MNTTTTPVAILDDLDDTARLILMDQPDISAPFLRQALRTEGFNTSLEEFLPLWTKYRGTRGRSGRRPTHDIETGERLR